MEIAMILYSCCSVTFLLFAIDKLKALAGRRRIPEAVLLTACLLGGALGGLLAMLFCWHKVRKPVFLITVPLLFILQWVGAYFLLCYFYGRSRLLWL